MNQMIAYCGIDCEQCDAYIATQTNDDTLREKTAALWSELNNAPITADMINCDGCRTKGRKTPYCESMCEIKKCASTKQYETCGDCFSLHFCSRVQNFPIVNPNAQSEFKADGQ